MEIIKHNLDTLKLSDDVANELSETASEKNFLSDVYYTTVELISENSQDQLLDMCLYHFAKPGKMLRSRLIYKLGQVYQTPIQDLLNWALSCELLHEASLIHDDLQDGDLTRRDQLSVWNKFGSAQAINLGDFLLMLSYLPLSKAKAADTQLNSDAAKSLNLTEKLIQLHCFTALKLVQGQSSEFELNKSSCHVLNSSENFNGTSNPQIKNSVIESYLNCVRGKTGALFSSLAKGVGLLSHCEKDEVLFLEKTFLEIGVIFQIQDDILDLFGDKKRGFQGSDIQEGKYSVLISKHFDEYPEDIKVLKEILSKPREATSVKDISFVKELFLSKGTLVLCLELLEEIIFNLKKLLTNSVNTGFNPSLAKHIELMLQHILEPIHNLDIDSNVVSLYSTPESLSPITAKKIHQNSDDTELPSN